MDRALSDSAALDRALLAQRHCLAMDAGFDVQSLRLAAAQRGLAGASGRAVWLVLDYVLAGPARSGAVFHCSGQRLAADAAGHGHHIRGAQRAAARYLRTGANHWRGQIAEAVTVPKSPSLNS